MRIAHLSDFHARRHVAGHPQILKRRARLAPDLLAQAIAEISTHSPDVLAVTGDLVDVPFYGMNDPEILDRTKQDLDLLKGIINRIDCPVIYLYGNHDHPGSFRDIFGDQTLDQTIDGYRFVTFLDDEVRDNTAERLGDQRERFDRVLSDSDPTPQIHLQHYVLWPERNEGYPHSYRDSTDLKTRITESGKVTLSLSGHYHAGVDAYEEDGTWFATSRAFCEHPHPYRLYEIDGDQIHQTEITIDTPASTQSLFLDLFGLMDQVLENKEFITALRMLREKGWTLVGVSSPGELTSEAFEMSSDVLVERLGTAGCELDAVVYRRTAQTSGAEPYRTANQDLGVDFSASRALVGSPTEASAARSLEIPTASTRPDRVIAALERLISP